MKRTFAKANLPESRDLLDYQPYVDVSIDNPGTMQTYEEDDGSFTVPVDSHVRIYDEKRRFRGVWCLHSRCVEMPGPVLGRTRIAHFPRNGKLYCPHQDSEEEVQ